MNDFSSCVGHRFQNEIVVDLRYFIMDHFELLFAVLSRDFERVDGFTQLAF